MLEPISIEIYDFSRIRVVVEVDKNYGKESEDIYLYVCPGVEL